MRFARFILGQNDRLAGDVYGLIWLSKTPRIHRGKFSKMTNPGLEQVSAKAQFLGI